MNIAEKLKKLRESKGISQNKLIEELAEKQDVNLEYLMDDNITTYKKENLDIGKNLGLTDESIKNLKEITNRTMKKRINFLLGDIEILAKVLQTIEIWEDKRWEKMKKS